MSTPTTMFRVTVALTTAALLLGSTAIVAPARAQQPAQPFATPLDQNQTDQSQADPPARVGRLANTAGAVSYHAAGDTQWAPATMNFPVASGSSFWTEPNARAELELSSSRVALAGGTEIDIGTLDEAGLRATLTQGEVLLRPRNLAPNETWSLVTPRGTVTTSHAGRIVVLAGDTATPTVVTVLEGDATISGPGLEQRLTAGQAATIAGTDTLQATVGPADPDAFARQGLVRDRPPLPPPSNRRTAPPPPAIASIPGGEDLQGYGAWNVNPDYGEVWYPDVDPGWVPYRQGHWAFIAPWGWTWVDDAPWGFAPFHYGRWMQFSGRWGWAPWPERDRDWRERYPVYAPALVTFLAFGAGASIGWVPLAPHERYRPWFHASDRYLGAVNRGAVGNVAPGGGFRNRAAATMVPTSAMTSSRPIRPLAQPIGPQTFATARPLMGVHPVQPTAATAGVTPVTAQNLHLAPAGAAFVRAPGPVVTARPAAPVGAAAPLPTLRPPTLTAPGSAQAPIHTASPMVVPGAQGPASVPRLSVPPTQSPPGAPPRSAPPQPVPQFAAPPAVHQPAGPVVQRPQFASPPVMQQPASPVVQHPAPQFAAPPVVRQPPAAAIVQHPTPQVAAPSPPAPHIQPPPPQVHAAPPPPVQHVQQPPPQVHAAPPPPVQHVQPPPPQVHAAPPPPVQHVQQPPPQIHAAPPPAQPPPAPQPHEKKPGER
jgi:hypothetical protein